VVIIGGGPAGLAAALYASRGRYSTLVIERGSHGGRLRSLGPIEDYPGYPEGISGPDLGTAMWEQAMKFGAESLDAEATQIGETGALKLVRTTAGDVRARAVIV